MTNLNANNICNKYNFSKSIAGPIQVTGGLIHRMWKVQTKTEYFAIKEINS